MRKYFTPSIVISLIALTLSFMGAGYAALTLPRDSVGRAQIKAGAVGSSEIANGSLRPVDFSKAAIRKLTGVQGPKGDAGARGETGPAGAAGSGGSGGGTGLNVTGGDGTVVGKFVSFDGTNDRLLTIQMSNGMLARYEPTQDSTWTRSARGPLALSLAADCNEPRYTLPRDAASWPNDGIAWYNRDLDWAFTVGTQRISLAGSTPLYTDFGDQGDGRRCFQWATADNIGNPSGEFIQLQPTAVPPVLTTPVRIG